MTPEELLAIVRAFVQRDLLAQQVHALRARVQALEASKQPQEGTEPT